MSNKSVIMHVAQAASALLGENREITELIITHARDTRGFARKVTIEDGRITTAELFQLSDTRLLPGGRLVKVDGLPDSVVINGHTAFARSEAAIAAGLPKALLVQVELLATTALVRWFDNSSSEEEE